MSSPPNSHCSDAHWIAASTASSRVGYGPSAYVLSASVSISLPPRRFQKNHVCLPFFFFFFCLTSNSCSSFRARFRKRLKELGQVYNEAIAIQKKKEKALRNNATKEGCHFPGTGHQEADPRSSNMEVVIPSQQLLPVVARKKGNKRKMPPSVSASPSTVQVINAVW